MHCYDYEGLGRSYGVYILGCLKATFKLPEDKKLYSHGSGIYVKLSDVIKKGETIVVSFYAKSLSGCPYLNVDRRWGGSTIDSCVELTNEWKKHTVKLTVQSNTNALLFNLIDNPDKARPFSPIQEGSFLLDNVEVKRIVEK